MRRFGFGLGLLLLLAGCAPSTTSYIRSDVDYSFINRVAVLPFQNLSQDLHAGTRLHSVFTSAVLERDVLQVVDLGETLAAMVQLRISPDGALTPEQIVALGEELQVEAIFTGVVEEYGPERVSNDRVYMITASFNMLETQTGSLVWKAQAHSDGTSLMRKLFGGGSASLFAVSQETVNEALETLF